MFPTSPTAPTIITLKIMSSNNAQCNSRESIYRVTEPDSKVYTRCKKISYFIEVSPEKRPLVYLIQLKIFRPLMINLFQNAFSTDVRRRRDFSKLKLNHAHSECAMHFHRTVHRHTEAEKLLQTRCKN